MSKLIKRAFAWTYHNVMGGVNPDDPFTRDRRIPLVQRATGDVLEIGAGDGANLPLYGDDVRLSLVEPNPYMVRYLREACADSDTTCAEIIEGVGEDLPFPDDHFDTVVMTHVLCSVTDQAQVLSEIRRVLRPGGVFLFLEHVADHPDTGNYRWQQRITPAWRVVGDGCHLTRDTGAAIRAAGFSDVNIEDFHAPYPGLIAPHVIGEARA